MSNFGTESQSLLQKSEEIESVEKPKEPVGCFYAARKKRDKTVSAASGSLPTNSASKKKKAKKPKQKKNEQPVKEVSQRIQDLRNLLPKMDWNPLVQDWKIQKQLLPLKLLIFHVKTLKCLILCRS